MPLRFISTGRLEPSCHGGHVGGFWTSGTPRETKEGPLTYRYLTFDCYGTLIDWRTGIEQELRGVLGDIPVRGRELLARYAEVEAAEEATYKKYREVLRETAISLSGALGMKMTDEAATRFAASVPRWPAFSDTGRFLRDMGSLGFKRYILSNVDNDLLEETIKRNGLQVDGVVTAEEVGSYKPRPGHWVKFMQTSGAREGDMLHVAQSVYHDIIPTQDLGISSAWVNRYNEPLARGALPLYVTDSLAHLAKVLTEHAP
jgi:2-haloalkanoic acid dehalogenase type II